MIFTEALPVREKEPSSPRLPNPLPNPLLLSTVSHTQPQKVFQRSYLLCPSVFISSGCCNNSSQTWVAQSNSAAGQKSNSEVLVGLSLLEVLEEKPPMPPCWLEILSIPWLVDESLQAETGHITSSSCLCSVLSHIRTLSLEWGPIPTQHVLTSILPLIISAKTLFLKKVTF